MLPAIINVQLGDNTDDGGLGLDKQKSYYVFDFWNWKLIGKIAGNKMLEQNLRPGEARVMAIHDVKNHPQFLSTNRHLLQGYLDMQKYPQWKTKEMKLKGISRAIAEEEYKIVIATNGFKVKSCKAGNAKYEMKSVADDSIYELSIISAVNANIEWEIEFEKKQEN